MWGRSGPKRRIARLATLGGSCLLAPSLAAALKTPPVADAGPDQNILVDKVTALDGGALDPDGNDIAWIIESLPVHFVGERQRSTVKTPALAKTCVATLVAGGTLPRKVQHSRKPCSLRSSEPRTWNDRG
jgi:hypothetical protein